MQVIVVDDDSTDATVNIVKQANLENVRIIQSAPLSAGWSGKLWAQEQGLQAINTPLTLLLDADIELQPGIIKSLKDKRIAEN